MFVARCLRVRPVPQQQPNGAMIALRDSFVQGGPAASGAIRMLQRTRIGERATRQEEFHAAVIAIGSGEKHELHIGRRYKQHLIAQWSGVSPSPSRAFASAPESSSSCSVAKLPSLAAW